MKLYIRLYRIKNKCLKMLFLKRNNIKVLFCQIFFKCYYSAKFFNLCASFYLYIKNNFGVF